MSNTQATPEAPGMMSTLSGVVRHALTFSPRRASAALGLTAVWCAIWGSVSVANVVSGLLVSTIATTVRSDEYGGIRLVPLAKFLALVLWDLAKATTSVAWEVLTPTDYTDEAIIDVHLPMSSGRHLLALTVAITVTPGTAVVEADSDTGTLYLHVLHRSTSDDVRAHVEQLARLACAALPDGSDVVGPDDVERIA